MIINNKSIIFILTLVIVIGLYLRLMYLPAQAITFGYDQARDAYESLSIMGGDFKLQGPPASTPGLFHGVLYYYLLLPAYLIGNGNPIVANIWLSLVNILTVIPIFFLGKILFNKSVGIISTIIFVVSLDAVQYANWMSNPAPAVFFCSLFYLGLGQYIFKTNKKSSFPIVLTAIGLGFSVQSEIFLGYLFLPLIIALFIFKIKPTIKDTVLFSIIFLLSTITMIIAYFKFGFTIISGFNELFNKSDDPSIAWRNFSPFLELYLNRFAEYFYRIILPINIPISGIVGIIIVCFSISLINKKVKESKSLLFLLIMLFSHILIIAYGGHSTPFINVGLQTILVILVAFFLYRVILWNKFIGIIVLVFIISLNIQANIKYNKSGQIIFSIQKSMTLSNEKKAIDYTYNSSDGKHFSINTVTSPLWINTTWDYLYNWYGKSHYGRVPSFSGRDQTGYLGFLKTSADQEELRYLIIEPPAGIPLRFVSETIDFENTKSKIVEEKNFGEIIVQKRVIIK